MLHWLWSIPALPIAGFLVLVLFGSRLSRTATAVVGAGSVGISAVVSLLVTAAFLSVQPSGTAFSQTLWQWVDVAGFNPKVSLYLDALSVVMMLVVTFVGFLIHLYSTEFMIDDPGYRRFFAYMNLFVGAMLILVLAENLLLLYLGWEAVGLCSYLLIGFWYEDPRNGYAARKAFVVTRIGDTAMMIGLFLLFIQLETLQIQPMMQRAQQAWPVGSALPTIAALLLLGGAVGKSAQLPLQVWLPDAMAGPSPVSALIHAATMVTAGVYLIARTHAIFTLAPAVLTLVAMVGAATLLLSGFSALVQHDIKRVLAYSTISQIGYMFIALGVGAWSAAIFHFMIHAFFKALLFLGAGAVIQALEGEHDIFKMGGLRHELPVTFWTFLIGGAALSAVPLVTAGFYSKDLILWEAYASTRGGLWLWAAALAGALLTSLYTFRMVLLTFFGSPKKRVTRRPGWRIQLPLVILAGLSLVAGFIQTPPVLGGVSVFSSFLQTALPKTALASVHGGQENSLMGLSGFVSLAGIFLIVVFYNSRRATETWARTPTAKALHRFWFAGWGFDRAYRAGVIAPYVWTAKKGADDVVDRFFRWVGLCVRYGHLALSFTQTGRIRSYAAGIAFGAVLVIGLAVFL